MDYDFTFKNLFHILSALLNYVCCYILEMKVDKVCNVAKLMNKM